MTEVVSIERDGADAAREDLERTIEDGGVAVFPADTLYGLGCDPLNADAIRRLNEIKGRDDRKPSAVLYFNPLAMRELIAGIGSGARAAMGALLPGPVTLVIANPEHRYPLAAREDPGRLGVRLIEGPLLGHVAAPLPDQRQPGRRPVRPPGSRTSIRRSWRPPISRSTAGSSAASPSTVVDVTGLETGGDWEVLREGALSVAEVAARLDLD